MHVIVPSGPQLLPTPRADRAAWNFLYSFNSCLPDGNADLTDYDAELYIDLDPSTRTRFLKLDLARLSADPAGDANGLGWKSGNTVVIGDDEGTACVTQNSQNLAFYASLIDTDPHVPGVQPYTYGPGTFEVMMLVKEHHDRWDYRRWHWWHRGDIIGKVDVFFDVVNP